MRLRQVGRRGLVSGLAALAGAAVARLTGSGQAEATHGPGTGTPGADSLALHIGQINPARTDPDSNTAAETHLDMNNAFPTSLLNNGLTVFQVLNRG